MRDLLMHYHLAIFLFLLPALVSAKPGSQEEAEKICDAYIDGFLKECKNELKEFPNEDEIDKESLSDGLKYFKLRLEFIDLINKSDKPVFKFLFTKILIAEKNLKLYTKILAYENGGGNKAKDGMQRLYLKAEKNLKNMELINKSLKRLKNSTGKEAPNSLKVKLEEVISRVREDGKYKIYNAIKEGSKAHKEYEEAEDNLVTQKCNFYEALKSSKNIKLVKNSLLGEYYLERFYLNNELEDVLEKSKFAPDPNVLKYEIKLISRKIDEVLKSH